MKKGSILGCLVLVLFGPAAFAHANTYTISDRYGPNDPYYNGSPYIPVPASVLYGCHSQDCLVPTQPVVYQNQGTEKGIVYVQPQSTNYYTNTVYPTTYSTNYPGIPNTGVGGEGVQNLVILAAMLLGVAGAGVYLLRTRKHG